MGVCVVCGKNRMRGNNVSHAHNKTKRDFKPNLQRIKIISKGGRKRALVCTRCIRSGKVVKAV